MEDRPQEDVRQPEVTLVTHAMYQSRGAETLTRIKPPAGRPAHPGAHAKILPTAPGLTHPGMAARTAGPLAGKSRHLSG